MIPLLIYGAVVAGLLAFSIVLSCRGNWAVALIVAGIATGLLAQLFWAQPVYLLQVLPVANAIAFANWFPFAVALASPGFVYLGKTRGQKIRIGVLSVVLFGVSLLGTVRLFAPPAEIGPPVYFADNLVRQSSADTCSAAAGASLLRSYGVEVTEQRMAELALSKRERGTHPLGIYRALKLAIAESTATAHVRYGFMDIDELLARTQPAIVNVGLVSEPGTAEEVDLVAKYQWQPGVVHSVLYLRTEGDKVWIADPDMGTEDWPIEQFRMLYRGSAFYLEE